MTALLLLVGVASVGILLIHVAALYHSRWYIPLQMKSLALDHWLALAAMIHMWSTLVSYDTEPEFHAARVAHCTLWSYWIQLFLGLQPWVLLMFFRVLQHGRDFHQTIKNWSSTRFKLVHAGLAAVSAVTLGAICAAASSTVAMVDDECRTPLDAKLPVIIWSAAMLCLLATLGAEVYRKLAIKTRSGRALRDCVAVALVVLVVISGVHITDTEDKGPIIVPMVVFLHSFVTLRCFGIGLWKALSHDHNYAETVFSKPGEAVEVKHRSVFTLDKDQSAMQKFLLFVRREGNQDLEHLYQDVRAIITARLDGKDTTDSWEIMKDEHEDMLTAILGTQADHIDAIPPETLYHYVIGYMHVKLWNQRTSGDYVNGDIFAMTESEASSGEIVYAELGDFENRTSSSDSTDSVTYASLRDFVHN
jgi:hypothetical protein